MCQGDTVGKACPDPGCPGLLLTRTAHALDGFCRDASRMAYYANSMLADAASLQQASQEYRARRHTARRPANWPAGQAKASVQSLAATKIAVTQPADDTVTQQNASVYEFLTPKKTKFHAPI